jgi:hypothetical protein
MGKFMVPDVAPVVAVVIVLFFLAYFAMASIPFLFVRLDIPEVWRLLRGLFNVYFWAVCFIGILAAIAFATTTHAVFAAAMLLLAVAAIAFRKTVLQRIDAHQSAAQSGDTVALRQLPVFHWGGMLINVAILASVASSLPFLF